jgi:hypothetical protein
LRLLTSLRARRCASCVGSCAPNLFRSSLARNSAFVRHSLFATIRRSFTERAQFRNQSPITACAQFGVRSFVIRAHFAITRHSLFAHNSQSLVTRKHFGVRSPNIVAHNSQSLATRKHSFGSITRCLQCNGSTIQSKLFAKKNYHSHC